MCPLCNQKVNGREHAVNECESTYYLRRELVSKVGKEVKAKKGNSVLDLILEYYYADNRRRKALSYIKQFAKELYGSYTEVKL